MRVDGLKSQTPQIASFKLDQLKAENNNLRQYDFLLTVRFLVTGKIRQTMMHSDWSTTPLAMIRLANHQCRVTVRKESIW